MKMQQKFRRNGLAATVILGFLMASFVPASMSGASPQSKTPKPSTDFASCVDRNKTGAAIILMDESTSVYNVDPKNNRLQGVQLFIDELSDLASYRQAKIQVQLAGMGARYTTRSQGDGGWTTLQKGATQEVSNLKSSASTAWSGKSGTGYANKAGTDIWDALDNAKQQLSASGTSCKLLLFFKDGADWQFYAREGADVKLPEAQEAREEGDFREADEIAAEDICRPLGLADSLRSDDIYTVLAGLEGEKKKEDFSQLASLALGFAPDGSSCGEQVGKGDFIKVEGIAQLQLSFANIFEKNKVTKGNQSFRLSPGLTSIRVVSSAVNDSYKIIPPTGCNVGSSQEIGPKSADTGTFGSAVNWSRTTYGNASSGEKPAMRVVIAREQTSKDYSCWSGVWKISASDTTLTAIKFDANLKAVLKFNEGDGFNPVLFPGKSQKFKVILQRTDDPSIELNAQEINDSLDYSAQATLFSPDGEAIDTLFDSGLGNGILPRSSFFGAEQELAIDKDWPIGTYKVQVTLDVRVLDSDIDLNPMKTEMPIIVGNLIKAPTVLTQMVSLGTISGASPSKGVLQVQGGDEDACILFDQGEVKLTAAPKGVSYSLGGDCINIPAGQTVEVPFQISPTQGSEGSAVGPVDGKFILQARLMKSETTVIPMAAVSFTGYQDAAPNEIARWILIAVFMAMSVLLSNVLLMALSKLVARFPKQEQVARLHLQSLAIPVKVSKYELKSTDGRIDQKLEDLELPQWIRIEKNRRSAMVSGFQLIAKSAGIKLASPGFAEVQGDFIGIGGPSVEGAPGNSSKATTGLGLQNTWMLLFSPFELEGKVADDSFSANAQLVIVIDANASIDKKMQLVANAETLISQKLESLIQMASKPKTPEGKAKSTKAAKTPKVKKTKGAAEEPKPEPEAPKNDPWAF
jgi:hypothetical protein